MPIEIQINASARIRQLSQQLKLTAEEIRDVTGYPLPNIRAALAKGERRKMPKSRAR